MYAIKSNEKRGHEFEIQEGVYGKTWREGKGREKCCNYILISKNFFKKNKTKSSSDSQQINNTEALTF